MVMAFIYATYVCGLGNRISRRQTDRARPNPEALRQAICHICFVGVDYNQGCSS